MLASSLGYNSPDDRIAQELSDLVLNRCNGFASVVWFPFLKLLLPEAGNGIREISMRIDQRHATASCVVGVPRSVALMSLLRARNWPAAAGHLYSLDSECADRERRMDAFVDVGPSRDTERDDCRNMPAQSGTGRCSLSPTNAVFLRLFHSAAPSGNACIHRRPLSFGRHGSCGTGEEDPSREGRLPTSCVHQENYECALVPLPLGPHARCPRSLSAPAATRDLVTPTTRDRVREIWASSTGQCPIPGEVGSFF